MGAAGLGLVVDARTPKHWSIHKQEEDEGYPRLDKARDDNRRTLIEETYRRLSNGEA